MSELYNFYYQSASGNIYYGQVVGSNTPGAPYDYSTGQTIASNGGTYYIGAGVSSTLTPGYAVCTSYYDKGTNTTYNSYSYSPQTGQYYNMSQPYTASTGGYNPSTGEYYAPNSSTGTSVYAGTMGLGSEYDYVMANGTYNVYGGGGKASAMITPSTLGTHTYDYEFMYPNGSYYTGTVVDNGTFGYATGKTYQTPYGIYSITGEASATPSANELAGYVYNSTYYNSSTGLTYQSYDATPGSSYYGAPTGYGGLGSEQDYVQIGGSYYAYGYGGMESASTSSPVASVPPSSF